MNISIIGFGNMAKYLAHGLLKNNHLRVASPSLSIGITENNMHTHHDNSAIIPDADIIILAVKPAQMQSVLTEIKPSLSTGQLIISIAAGLTCRWFHQYLPPHMPLVRAIPNLAAKVGQSATPLIANAFVTSEQRKMTERIFLANGIITWATEEQELDAYTALSGSGPAYVFMWMDAMVKAAMALGLPEKTATNFAIQTVRGAATLAATDNKSLIDLQQAVTSKGGTTAAALEVFQREQLDEIILKAMTAACERSKALDLS